MEGTAEITTQTPTGTAEAVTTQQPQDIKTPETGGNGQKPSQPADEGAISEAIRKFKLKLSGKEEELDITNAEHRERLARMAQKGESADRKFNEAALMRKQNEEFIRLLKTNPEAVLANPAIGLDVKEWAEKFLWQRLQEEKMSPEQRKALQMEKELEIYRQAEIQRKQEEQFRAFEEQKKQYRGRLEADIIKTLETSGLPKTPRTVARIAHYMLEAKRRGWADVTPADVMETVWKEYVDEHNQFYGALPLEKLKSILNPDLRKRFRELDMADVKQPGQPLGKKDQPPSDPEKRDTGKKKLTMEEWREKRQKMLEE